MLSLYKFIVADTDFTGAHMTLGNVLKCSMMGGQISSENLDDGVLDESAIKNDHVNFVGVNLQYEITLDFLVVPVIIGLWAMSLKTRMI